MTNLPLYVIFVFMKRASTLDRLQRLELLTARVKSAVPTTIGEIADELGVSVRTISRDIQVLRDHGLPIEADRGRGGGVRLNRQWGVGRVNFSYSEAVDLLVSLAVAERMESPLFMANLKTVRHKLMASFSPLMTARVNGLKARILIGQAASPAVMSAFSTPDRRMVEQLHQAFLMQRRIRIEYRAEKGAVTERNIQPHFLLLCNPVWYVLAWDELRDEVRTFRCDRIAQIQTREDGFSLLPLACFEQALAGIQAIGP